MINNQVFLFIWKQSRFFFLLKQVDFINKKEGMKQTPNMDN